MQTLILFLLFTVFGWFMLFVGIRSDSDNRLKVKKERTLTTGKVVRHAEKEEWHRRRRVILHFPVIEYTVDNHVLTLQSGIAVEPDCMLPGTVVDIYYDPDAPENSHLGSETEFRRGGRNLIRIGLIWIGACLFFFLALGTISGRLSFSTPHFLQRIESQLMLALNRSRPNVDSDQTHPHNHTAEPVQKTVEKREYEKEEEGKVKEKEIPLYEAMPGEFEYSIKDGTAILEKFTELNSKRRLFLSIPDHIDGYMVTGMTSSTFADFLGYPSVSIPGTIRVIPSQIFARWRKLKTLRIEPGVETIESEAFIKNGLLASVFLPGTVSEIAEDAFKDDCTAMFYVQEESFAEQYCQRKGFRYEYHDFGQSDSVE